TRAASRRPPADPRSLPTTTPPRRAAPRTAAPSSSSRSSRERDAEPLSGPVEPPRGEGAFLIPETASPPRTGSGLVVVTFAAAVALLYYGRLFFITIAFALFLAF